MTMNFNDIVPSTRTIINVMNIKIDITKLFDEIQTTPYHFPSTKRGRRKKNDVKYIVPDVPNGSIINARYENLEKGVFKTRKRGLKYFRNTLTITMMNEGSLVSFKIFTSKGNNGTKTQHTGCKTYSMVGQTILHLYKLIKDKSIFTFIDSKSTDLVLLLHTVMTNINFNIGFVVSRQELHHHINTIEKYNSMLETNIGHAGINISIPVSDKIPMDDIPKITIDKYFGVSCKMVPFQDYLNCLSDKQKDTFYKKIRKNTFLVFYSGKTIMSGFDQSHMKSAYEDFIKDIYSMKHMIQDKHSL